MNHSKDDSMAPKDQMSLEVMKDLSKRNDQSTKEGNQNVHPINQRQ